jgi:hypothetical protein
MMGAEGKGRAMDARPTSENARNPESVRIRREPTMDQREDGQRVYLCPMHSGVRQASPGKCPECGMDLLPEGARFGMLRHMIKNPVMLAIMAAIMIAVMAAVMHFR